MEKAKTAGEGNLRNRKGSGRARAKWEMGKIVCRAVELIPYLEPEPGNRFPCEQ